MMSHRAVSRLASPAGLALLWLVCGAMAGRAGTQAPLETQVKAAYLFKFPSYVDWPGMAFPRPDMPCRAVGTPCRSRSGSRATSGSRSNCDA